ncbi:COPI associated protein [Nitzschia inconspicua]|uniref:COPI associated protein n=1 Tax=Nitzschia inconspicua TaxID=303405 RepID=A0A9K3LLK2_9STRA|nr:COPI associated protein [Nitzschia inconspicua]
MGLSFFQGNRTTTKKTGGRNVNRKNNTDAATAEGPATDYQQFSTSSPISNPSIPVAVPIAYVPPPTSSSSAPHQQQKQKHIVPTSNAGAATNSRSAGGRLGNRNHATAMTIANEELDHNIRLGLRSTFGARTLLHKAFIVLSILTILTAINNIIAHTLSLLIYGRYEDPMEQILRVFTIGWYFLVILIETNRSALVQQSFVFQHWAARGIFYVFLGVLSAVEYDVGSQNYGSYRDRYNRYSYGQRNFVIYIPSGEDAFELYVFATGITMLLIGLVYTLLGACCLHERYQRLQAQFEQRQRLATTGQQPSFPSDHRYP